MVRHLVVPSVCLAPREECAVKLLELTWRIGFPFVARVVVIEDDEHASGFGGLFHLRNGQRRFSDPLECPCGSNYVELRTEGQSRRIAILKLQVRKCTMLCSREFEEHLVAIDADYESIGSNSLRNARSDGTGAAADIKHRKSRPQQFGKAAMISLKGSSTEDSRIGSVRPSRHILFTIEQQRRRASIPSSRGGQHKRQMDVQASPIPALTGALATVIGRAVLDKTGLAGKYNLHLQWVPEAGPSLGGVDASLADGPSIFAALEEQVELLLESQKGLVEVIVIEYLERPTGN
jgi:hypothetical protein